MSDPTKAFLHAFRNGDADRAQKALAAGAEVSGETFKSVSCGRIDLSAVDLSNTEFEDCLLSGIRFDGADLSGAYFHGSTLMECSLAGANLDGASFDGCVLKQVDLAGAVLTGTELSGTELADCTIADSSLDDATWESVTISGGSISRLGGAAELTAVVIRDTELDAFDTSDMELRSCTTNAANQPEGFGALSGRRTRIG